MERSREYNKLYNYDVSKVKIMKGSTTEYTCGYRSVDDKKNVTMRSLRGNA